MLEERELLVLLQKGDEYAFKRIFNLYIRRVYQFIYGYLKNKPDAEDDTQTVFQKLWESRAKIKESHSLNNFLYTIAYNATIDHIRKFSNDKRTLPIDEHGISLLPSLETFSDGRKIQSLYETSVNLLPPKRREIYLLSRHDGLTNKQIAEKLNLSIKTVEHQISSAMIFLREYFKNIEE